MNAYAYVNNNPVNFNDPSGKDCKSSGGMTTCTPPYDGAPTVSFTTPTGFPTTITNDSTNQHDYNVQVTANNVNPNLLRQGLVDNPTPGNLPPATTEGTINDATPTIVSQVSDTVSLVNSYIRTDANGNTIIVNATLPGHPLFPGYVMRTVTDNGDGSVTVNNYDEGTGWRQAEWNPMKYPIKWFWIFQTQRIIDGLKGGGFVIYSNSQ